MRLAILLLLLTPAIASAQTFTVENKANMPVFTVVNKVPAATIKKKTTCDCGFTGDCTCYASTCACSACGLGGKAATPSPFPPGASTEATPARGAVTPRPQDTEPGLSGATPPEGTFTLVKNAGQAGTTSPCANGQCQSSSTRLFRWRK